MAPPAAPPAASTPDPIALLTDLGRLHEAGTLTDEEFAAQKAKILGQL
ncbi:MAG TPA: SHOCT domain-containing protein [Intrasporangium sp.]|nr:SHOCT domain-containing protein [Intrasporangium sp.]